MNSGTESILCIVKFLGNYEKNEIENSYVYSLFTDGSTGSSVAEKEAFFVMKFQ